MRSPDFTKGITIGKFMPLHKGHELMIKFGSYMLDELVVLVSGNEKDEIPVLKRYEWVWDFVRTSGLENVKVIYHEDCSPEYSKIDEEGTVLDKDFQDYWVNEFRHHAPDATHFVSSDMYGKKMAELLGIQWLPVDPDREMIKISASSIRRNTSLFFYLISDAAKNYFTKKIAIVGAESTGKSTMTKKLTDYYYPSEMVSEYGRTLSEAKNNDLTEDDFWTIAKGQRFLIAEATERTKVPKIFIDTEAYTTYLFSKIYLGKKIRGIRDIYARTQDIDHYIVLAPDVEWVDDGSRVIDSQEDRVKFHESLIDLLEQDSKPYTVISGSDYKERVAEAIKIVDTIEKPV